MKRQSHKSKVRFVRTTHDGLSVRHSETIKTATRILSVSRAGLSELDIEQNSRRGFMESVADFNERVLYMRSRARKEQLAQER